MHLADRPLPTLSMRVLEHVGSLRRPAAHNPVRRIFLNIAVTTLSGALAMVVGTVLLLQMAARALGLGSGFWAPVQSLDLGHLG